MSTYSFGDGRIWYQRKKFEGYSLLLPYGMTNVTDPVGAMTQVREPSAAKRRTSVVSDVLRGEPALPEFQIETRLAKTLNLMFGLKDCTSNFQTHMGACDRPDNYYSSEIALHWERAHRGDMTLDRLAKIEGDDAPVAMTVPFMAEIGPIVVDFDAEFLSARSISETEAITDLAFLGSECMEDCKAQEDAGENGYAVTEVLAGSPTNVANVWYTEDRGESWSECSARPLDAGMTISSVVVAGIKGNHRVIVSNGTSAAGAAQVAYADVTEMGTTAWVQASVGSVNGQYINKLFLLDWLHVYAVTDDGYVYISADGGATWSIALSTAVEELWDIEALGYGERAGSVWVVGDANVVYFSEDYGSSWSAITGPADGAGDNLKALALCPDGTVIIGNDAGEVYGSYDNGASWTTLAAQGVTATEITALEAWGDSLIWMAVTIAGPEGRVLRSTDGGATFRLWSLNMPANSGINALAPIDPNVVFAGGEPHGGIAFITRTKSTALGTLSQSLE